MFIGDTKDRYPKPDGKYTFDKLSSVFITGNATRDDAPNHIRVQKHVPREIAETWRWMCPAGVYEIPEDAPETRRRRRDRQLHQLRAVRRDHRQGRPPDAARGRRRPALPRRSTLDSHRCETSGARPLLNRGRCAESPLTALLAASRPRSPRRAAACRVVKLPLTAHAAGAAAAGRDPAERVRRLRRPMPALQARSACAMRFDLYERPRGTVAAAHVVDVPRFGAWETSRAPASRAFIYTKRVDQLQAPAAYRAVVRFRWYDAQGRLQRRRASARRACHAARPAPGPRRSASVDRHRRRQRRLRYADPRAQRRPRRRRRRSTPCSRVDGVAQPPATSPGLPPAPRRASSSSAPRCAAGSRDPGRASTRRTSSTSPRAQQRGRAGACPMPAGTLQ